MTIWPNDFIYGDFRASEYGLIPGRFDGTPDFTEDEIGMSLDISEQFIGSNAVPVHISTAHNGKLLLTITLVKNPCIYADADSFTEFECRNILRKISKKYQWTRIINYDNGEDIWFRCIVDRVSYNRLGNKVHGITLSLQCDSMYGWSVINTVRVEAQANKPFYIFNNTDELEEYVLPTVKITVPTTGTFTLTNQEENRIARINNVHEDETFIMDCKNKIITSNHAHSLLLNDFNMNWIRLIPDKNSFVVNKNCTVVFEYRVPRKAGVVG